MFAAVVREGMLIRTPTGRVARVLWATEREPMGFFEIEYMDNEEKGTLHCRLMRHAAMPRDEAGEVIVNIKSTLDPDIDK